MGHISSTKSPVGALELWVPGATAHPLLSRPLVGQNMGVEPTADVDEPGLAETGSDWARWFAAPARWPDDDLIAVSSGIDPVVVAHAYRGGVFPMPADDGVMGWWSPVHRGVLPLAQLRVTRSLRKMRPRYRIRFDTAFDQVLDRCAEPDRSGGWIDEQIRTTYRALYQAGIVHSVEAWDHDDRLVGGLYGVSIGGLFAGESMFHDPERGRDASKVALVALVELLRAAGGDRLLDVQWLTPHLASLGAIEIDRAEYLGRLQAALRLPPPTWPAPAADPGR